MPLFDLRERNDGNQLDERAPLILPSVMIHPGDAKARERFMARHLDDIGSGNPRRSSLAPEDASYDLWFSVGRGWLAGFVYLILIQLHHNHRRPSVDSAIRIVQSSLPEFTQWDREHWRVERAHEHIPRSRRAIRKYFHRFLTVGHLWAAHVHAHQNQRQDLWPDRIESLPAFLGYAEAFAELFGIIPLRSLKPPPKKVSELRWQFKIPQDLVVCPEIVAQPLPDEWEGAITR